MNKTSLLHALALSSMAAGSAPSLGVKPPSQSFGDDDFLGLMRGSFSNQLRSENVRGRLGKTKKEKAAIKRKKKAKKQSRGKKK